MNSLLRVVLVALVIGAAVVRGAGLLRFASYTAPSSPAPPSLRHWLGLPSDHRISGLIAQRGSTADAPPRRTTGLIWWDASASATVILPDASGQLRIGQPPIDIAEREPGLLSQLDPSHWTKLPATWQQLTVYYWDPSAAVFVTAGPDGHPGIAGVDDDGSGTIDDPQELGATGSDDFVVAPGQRGYEQAAGGEVLARLISRGAQRPLDGQLQLPLLPGSDAAAEVWLQFSGSSGVPTQRILLRIEN